MKIAKRRWPSESGPHTGLIKAYKPIELVSFLLATRCQVCFKHKHTHLPKSRSKQNWHIFKSVQVGSIRLNRTNWRSWSPKLVQSTQWCHKQRAGRPKTTATTMAISGKRTWQDQRQKWHNISTESGGENNYLKQFFRTICTKSTN